MKKSLLLMLFIIICSGVSAHDIEVANDDGKMIYYNYSSDRTELVVTFRGESYNTYQNEYTGDVVIPKEVTYMNRTRKVTSIGESAFDGCTALTSVTISNSVTSINDFAFYGCTGLNKVIIPDIAAWCGITFGSVANPLLYAHHLYSDENTEITDLIIPNSVTTIGNGAFVRCTGLTSVTIGSSVTTIGNSAFVGCTGLTSVTIGSSVTTIGNFAFSECSGLTSVSIPNNVTHIGGDAFSKCSGLTSITIPNSVTSIGGEAFADCTSLTSVTIPNSVTSINYGVFYGCSGLTSVIIGNSVISIGDGAFWGCSGLASVTIPNSVTSIGETAFYSCSGLTSITIGSSVTFIGRGAFHGADIPTVISLIEEPFEIYEKLSGQPFTQNTLYNATLYVPVGTTEKYKTAEGWKDFMFIEEGNPTGINIVENTRNNNTTIYDLNGVRQSEPQRGINIINGKKVVKK